MRKVFTWVMAATLTACGGKVFVDGSSSGATTGAGGAPTTTGNNGGVGAVFDGAGGGPCDNSCSVVLFNGGFPCNGPGLDAYQAIQACACSSACSDSCNTSVCQTLPATDACVVCMKMLCMSQIVACETH